ncbi:MAG: nitrogenase component 1 [Elusimicrobiota bacterium]|jgi:hypothetical protein
MAEDAAWMTDPASSERHLVAGPKAMSSFRTLFGLEAGDWEVSALCGQGRENLRLALKRGARRFGILILPKDAGAGQVRGRGASLALEGGAGEAGLRLLKALAARLGDRSFEELWAVVDSDPDSFAERAIEGRTGDSLRVPYVGAPFGLQDAGWRNFYADQDFEVLLTVPDCSAGKTLTLQYADLECFYARPDQTALAWSFLDWPNDKEEESVSERSPTLEVELGERDMILGTTDMADAVIAKIKELTKAGKFLVVTHLCTPIVMGEDLCGLARRAEKIAGVTPVSWSQKDRDSNDNFGAYLRERFSRPGFFDVPADPAAVNLFHFTEAFRKAELVPFLESIGVKVNASVFPMMDFPSIERIPRAMNQVFCERSSYAVGLQEMLAAHPRRIVPVNAPYGLKGTARCLEAIAEAAGRGAAFKAAWKARMAEIRPEWERMRKEASGLAVAFVTSEAGLPRLFQVRHGFGAPLAVMAAEMGFGIEFLYYDPHGEMPPPPEELPCARVRVFRGPWELRELLAGDGFQAVYSDLAFDWRLSSAGKARFSSRDLDMGVDGCLRGFRKLLSACRMPFYRRYAGHLGRGRAVIRPV